MESGDFDTRLSWFKEAKFGMFIHWGLYAALGSGEWVMYGRKIPVKEYESIAETFNPDRFDAEAWVGLAKRAGMKYIVITAKHHDGFAMYGSETSGYNIADMTPFKRDPMKELAEECQKQGLKLCFYYSHVIDWHHPHAIHDTYNNTWDYELEEKAFYKYWNRHAKPQITELLTQYGPIGLLWFDTAGGLSKKDSQGLASLVRSLQPDCLINSRISHWPNMGDYSSKGDNEIPMYGEDTGLWETPMTLNDSWGFSSRDQVWKKPQALIRKLIDIASKGGNLLLNVGPTPEGVIPEQSVRSLLDVGEWMERYGEAVYGTSASPFPYEFEWGAVTVKPGYIYLFIDNESWRKQELDLYGIRSKVMSVSRLGDPEGRQLDFGQSSLRDGELHKLSISLPHQDSNEPVTVLAVRIFGQADIDDRLLQLPSGSLKLDMPNARVDASGNGHDPKPRNRATWQFEIVHPGTFELTLICFKRNGANWVQTFRDGVEVAFAEERVGCMPQEDIVVTNSKTCQHPYQEIHARLGQITVESPGTYTLSLLSDLIVRKTGFTEIWQAAPVRLRSVQLKPLKP
ncbi:alpha-L-fucosidase [Paenibacillus sp. MBLB4367]|uniref:alpha-L-fucosidase n=1 Tax=Paenibacillus sp. MBLB4367 TaxID=3384767 RepID=UPI003907F981